MTVSGGVETAQAFSEPKQSRIVTPRDQASADRGGFLSEARASDRSGPIETAPSARADTVPDGDVGRFGTDRVGEALERSARVREDELVAEALFLSEPRLTVLQDDRIAVTLMLDAFLAPTEPGVLDVIDFAIDRTVNDARSALQPANADGVAPARVSFPV